MTIRVRFVSSLVVSVASLFLLASAVQAQNVTTWHNDNYRTGWQSVETTLAPSSVSSTTFGLLAQWTGTPSIPMGPVFAQPLAVTISSNVPNCGSPCSLIIIADEQNNVFAYNASSNSPTPVWSATLAQPVGCQPLVVQFQPCESGNFPEYVGVTGTPVIDPVNDLLYVVAPTPNGTSVDWELFAVNILNGQVGANPAPIGGSVPGENPGSVGGQLCTSTYPAPGQHLIFGFDYIQRSALLFLRGIWGSGAGPAAETRNGSSYIYTVTGNGTWDIMASHPAANDFGDSALKLNPTNFSVLDYFTPSDVLNYPPPNGPGRCGSNGTYEDEDFSSGGIMLIPDAYYNNMNLMVNADKESNIYVLNRDNLGQYVFPNGNTSEGNNVETIPTPPVVPLAEQGYWASPAYWKYQDSNQTIHYLLYYAATSHVASAAPYALYQYVLQSYPNPPITTNQQSVDFRETSALFCVYSPTPSVSSSGTTAGSGIVWGIENPSPGNPANCETPQNTFYSAVLHAFDATTLNQLYTSGGLQTEIGRATPFSTTTIFEGRVYVGTRSFTDVNGHLVNSQVAVFGPCGNPSQCLP